MDLEALIGRANQDDLDAFAEVTRRFQHMAFGYALSIVRDLQQAEDVVQEAFVAAWFALITLADTPRSMRSSRGPDCWTRSSSAPTTRRSPTRFGRP